MKILKFFLACLAAFYFLPATGQTVLQVASKKVEKRFEYSAGTLVMIEGEKAEINVTTWSKKHIEVELILFAKNPDRAIAKSELGSFNYSFEEDGKTVKVRNYYSGGEPASELSAQYFLKVPEDCPVEMTNYFGKSSVENLSADLSVNAQFGPINLYNLNGDIDVSTRFGDLYGELLNGNIKIESHRSDVTLKQLKGKYNIKSKYGLIKVFADNRLVDLNIDAERSDVYLFNPEPTELGYELISHFGDIVLPEELKVNFVENTDAMRHAIYAPQMQHVPGIYVKITYGDIVVRKKPTP